MTGAKAPGPYSAFSFQDIMDAGLAGSGFTCNAMTPAAHCRLFFKNYSRLKMLRTTFSVKYYILDFLKENNAGEDTLEEVLSSNTQEFMFGNKHLV